MSKAVKFSTTLGLAVAAGLIAPVAYAGEPCATCYRKEVTPAQYRTVQETVVTRPATTVARTIPAQYGVVQQTVQTAPARQVWQRQYDAYGRETLCLVTVPAQYSTVNRTVMTRPASVAYETIPAQYGVVNRTELVAPATERWVHAGGGEGYLGSRVAGYSSGSYGYSGGYRAQTAYAAYDTDAGYEAAPSYGATATPGYGYGYRAGMSRTYRNRYATVAPRLGVGQPRYAQPGYGQPRYAQPRYAQPRYGQPHAGLPRQHDRGRVVTQATPRTSIEITPPTGHRRGVSVSAGTRY